MCDYEGGEAKGSGDGGKGERETDEGEHRAQGGNAQDGDEEETREGSENKGDRGGGAEKDDAHSRKSAQHASRAGGGDAEMQSDHPDDQVPSYSRRPSNCRFCHDV